MHGKPDQGQRGAHKNRRQKKGRGCKCVHRSTACKDGATPRGTRTSKAAIWIPLSASYSPQGSAAGMTTRSTRLQTAPNLCEIDRCSKFQSPARKQLSNANEAIDGPTCKDHRRYVDLGGEPQGFQQPAQSSLRCRKGRTASKSSSQKTETGRLSQRRATLVPALRSMLYRRARKP